MSGPKKDMMNLTEHGVVTEEALIAYLHNKLSPEEKQQLEKLLLEDPFAQDALEGLKSSLNQAAVSTSISSLNKKVRERAGLKERKKLQIHWVTYAWGAVIFLVLIGICFIIINFFNKKDNSPAPDEKKINTTTPVIQPKDTLAVSQKPDAIDSSAKKLPMVDTATVKVALPAPKGNSTDPQKPVTNDAKNIKDAVPNTVTGKATTTATKAPDSTAPKKTKTDSVKSTGSTDKNTPPTKTEVKDPAGLQNEAMNSFNSGDYNTAGTDFDQLLKHDPDNADALYFGGISDYINGKTGKSENNFDKLLKKGNKYVDGSKWYKANILIKKGHSESAKPLLQEISNSNSPYKERAIKKLAELGF